MYLFNIIQLPYYGVCLAIFIIFFFNKNCIAATLITTIISGIEIILFGLKGITHDFELGVNTVIIVTNNANEILNLGINDPTTIKTMKETVTQLVYNIEGIYSRIIKNNAIVVNLVNNTDLINDPAYKKFCINYVFNSTKVANAFLRETTGWASIIKAWSDNPEHYLEVLSKGLGSKTLLTDKLLIYELNLRLQNLIKWRDVSIETQNDLVTFIQEFKKEVGIF